MAFHAYSVCPWGIITELSKHVWNLYCALGGVSRIRTPTEYYDQAAIWVDGCAIIDREQNRWQKEQKELGHS